MYSCLGFLGQGILDIAILKEQFRIRKEQAAWIAFVVFLCGYILLEGCESARFLFGVQQFVGFIAVRLYVQCVRYNVWQSTMASP